MNSCVVMSVASYRWINALVIIAELLLAVIAISLVTVLVRNFRYNREEKRHLRFARESAWWPFGGEEGGDDE